MYFLLLQIPTNSAGLIEYRAHPFWHQKYCPSHERDGTPRCCSCERMEVSYHSSLFLFEINNKSLEESKKVEEKHFHEIH